MHVRVPRMLRGGYITEKEERTSHLISSDQPFPLRTRKFEEFRVLLKAKEYRAEELTMKGLLSVRSVFREELVRACRV